MTKSSELICCGMIDTGVDNKAYFNKADGSIVYKDENDDSWYYVSEVAAKDVNEIKDYDQFLDAINKGAYGDDIKGVILLKDMIIVLLDDATAETRPYYPASKPTGKTFSTDISIVCDTIDEDIEL